MHSCKELVKLYAQSFLLANVTPDCLSQVRQHTVRTPLRQRLLHATNKHSFVLHGLFRRSKRTLAASKEVLKAGEHLSGVLGPAITSSKSSHQLSAMHIRKISSNKAGEQDVVRI